MYVCIRVIWRGGGFGNLGNILLLAEMNTVGLDLNPNTVGQDINHVKYQLISVNYNIHTGTLKRCP